MSQYLRPNFLCIGFPRCGTTWLDAVLSSHPHIQMPFRKKEIHYFNLYYHLGEEWYLRFFPARKGEPPVAVGEVSPLYILSETSAHRIRNFGSIKKFIVMLRDPVSHFVSSYQFYYRYNPKVADRAYFLRHYEHSFFGLRSHFYLREFMEYFDKRQFLFLTKDELNADILAALQKTSEFLGVSDAGFDRRVANATYSWAQAPRFRFLYNSSRVLRDRWAPHFEWSSLVEERFSYLRRVFFRPHEMAPEWVFDELKLRKNKINDDTVRLGRLIGRDLSNWLIE